MRNTAKQKTSLAVKLAKKFSHAGSGFLATWNSELSFKIQILAALAAIILLAACQAPLLWMAVFLWSIGSVLSLELINTAIEKTIDALHPDSHPLLKFAKDAAAAGVMVASVVSVFILMLFVMDKLS